MCTLTAQPYGYRVNFRPAASEEIDGKKSRLEIIDRFIAAGKIVVEHIERHKLIYRIGAITLTVLLSGIGLDAIVHASAVGDTGLDVGARRLYARLVGIGKWVIIIKGAFDTISSTVQGDFVAARKSGLSYMLVYVILLGLPWAFGQIEVLFEGM